MLLLPGQVSVLSLNPWLDRATNISSEGALESLVLLTHEVCIEIPGLLDSANGVADMVPFRFHLE